MNLERFEQIGESFLTFIKGGYPIYALELILAFVLFYYVIKVLKDNNANAFVVAYSLLIAAGSVLALCAAGISLTLYLEFIVLLSMFFLLTYNLEIKRSLTKVKKDAHRSNFEAEEKTMQQTEACISALIKAVQNMSKKDTGALIVLANNNLPKQIIDSGIILDADISSQLIEGIFINKAPLHDGAMIINGHKIKAAGCFLPLTQNQNVAAEFGTRHRAAIGVTEVSDVITIVVSEETGIVSVVKKGKIDRYADYNMLRNVLIEYYWTGFNKTKKKTKEE